MISEVRDWLESQGFPLEMRVAAAFRKAGFDVRQSATYIDPESEKAREIDVIARHPDSVGVVEVQFIAECKSSRKPWVLLCSPDTLTGFNRLFAFGALSEKARVALVDRLARDLHEWPWFIKEDLVGYSLRQTHAGADTAYSAAMSVAKACDFTLYHNEGSAPTYIFTFPVIVVDTPLMRCWLSNDGELQLEEVDEGEFLFSARLPRDFATCIRVVTLKGLESYVVAATAVAKKIREELKVDEMRVVESWKTKGKRP